MTRAAATGRILLVDDDPGLRRLLSLRLESDGHEVVTAESAREALSRLTGFAADLVITDLRMAGMDGMALLGEIGRERPGLPVIVLTAHGTIPEAVTATQQGALDFLTKPVDRAALSERIQHALGAGRTNHDQGDDWATQVITRSAEMHSLLGEARMVAESDAAVLINGASGTGKELLARAIHGASPRADKPFVAINCGAMPEALLESELFGHEKGAFTDAKTAKPGLIRDAHGGSLLLDEIGDMPPSLQVKLLRALQEGEVRPVGGSQSVAVDIRVISATHRNLREAIAAGDFREDLYYRLNVVTLTLPPLAQRREDIPLLVDHFLKQLTEDKGRPPKVYAPDAMELLTAADWPGNIRQLRNMVEHNVALTRARVIGADQVRQALVRDGGTVPGEVMPPLKQARESFTRHYLIRLLQITGGNVSRSARLARRNRTEFYKLLSRHGIDPAAFK
ncbi:sigma 54-interacting transcriptional regulator [Spectribacter hydrogenooxidans]|uniref:Sigma 54-interacting transcriptional regulator n=1 Tax=Spectribacter hydrogenoxidans TaxID=3075608 RepID=A0ABU3C123_9GAMM|nr:sigma 54-interacting transcriptional regulator [Salinisphaera sp. W335]MDT0635244.1 sigma 54-interacting transcriptional regulator [Salinisphaera sp. W335]